MSSATAFKLNQSESSTFGKELTLPNNKFLDWSKLKDKLELSEKLKFELYRVENIVGKGENAGNPAFSPFPTMFSKGLFLNVVKN